MTKKLAFLEQMQLRKDKQSMWNLWESEEITIMWMKKVCAFFQSSNKASYRICHCVWCLFKGDVRES